MTSPRFQIKGLKKSFHLHILHGKVIPGFENVSFDVPQGAFIGIAGKSGSGKSSLLKCLYRTYLADEGEIIYHRDSGETADLVTIDDDTMLDVRNHEIGYVSQFLHPVPRVSALDLAARPLIHAGVGAAEANERVAHFFNQLELPRDLWDGYPILFSGGEQQRVNIARALASKSSVLLLDEPTSSLDERLQAKVARLMVERKNEGTTLIGIMHDQRLLSTLADSIVYMHDGAVVNIDHDPREVPAAEVVAS